MSISVGDTVYVEGWDTINGVYVKVCIVESIAGGRAHLRENKTVFADQRVLPSRPNATMDLDVSYFNDPIERRLEKQREGIQWLINQLRQ